MSARLRVAILGGGPAGVGAAYRLSREGRASVQLFESRGHFGGNAGSFELGGHRVDYGSHRLHPACDPEILADIRALLGDELIDRPRHGRIRLLDRWIHFPLRPVDLALRLDRRFALGAAADALGKLRPKRTEGDSFASVLRARLGPTICEHFYFPYARKIWGREPDELSPVQARRRVAASSFSKLAHKVFGRLPLIKKKGAGRFFYPRGGYGRISEAYAQAAADAGAELFLSTTVQSLTPPGAASKQWRIEAKRDGHTQELAADQVWSTLPIALLTRLVEGAAPEAVQASGKIESRAMVLIYVELPRSQFTEYDAHYFPGDRTRITRLSEPKNYAARTEPANSTILCAELPCALGDSIWRMDAAGLEALLAEDLDRSGIPLPDRPVSRHVERLAQAYPIYAKGYEEPFGQLEQWALRLPQFLTYGRQGLFAHDNTHHALFMAYRASDCLNGGSFDLEEWSRWRKVFDTHVVED